MGSKTKNLGLELTGSGKPDNNTLFSVWRTSINGEGVGSNMELIDDAYGVLNDNLNSAQSELEANIQAVHVELNDNIDFVQKVLSDNIDGVRNELTDHIAEAYQKLSEINNILSEMRAEYDQNFARAVMDGDEVIIVCGNAEEYMQQD